MSSKRSSSSHGKTSSSKRRCSSLTKTGEQCKNSTIDSSSKKCRVHSKSDTAHSTKKKVSSKKSSQKKDFTGRKKSSRKKNSKIGAKKKSSKTSSSKKTKNFPKKKKSKRTLLFLRHCAHADTIEKILKDDFIIGKKKFIRGEAYNPFEEEEAKGIEIPPDAPAPVFFEAVFSDDATLNPFGIVCIHLSPQLLKDERRWTAWNGHKYYGGTKIKNSKIYTDLRTAHNEIIFTPGVKIPVRKYITGINIDPTKIVFDFKPRLKPYGALCIENISTGSLTEKEYTLSGLGTKEQYRRIKKFLRLCKRVTPNITFYEEGEKWCKKTYRPGEGCQAKLDNYFAREKKRREEELERWKKFKEQLERERKERGAS